jgi:putative ABC transport system substrate-binding protein
VLYGLGVSLLTAPLVAEAQQAGRVYRIGYLGNVTRPTHLTKSFQDGLRELGYVEGKNLIVEYKFPVDPANQIPMLARELANLPVDLIVVSGTEAALAAKAATSRIPIVMTWSADPVKMGLVATLARPGGNVTGFTGDLGPEIATKRLALLKEAIPSVRRLAVLWNPSFPGLTDYWPMTDAATKSLGMTTMPVEVSSPADFDQAFKRILDQKPDAMFLFTDPLIWTNRSTICNFALRSRLPTLSVTREETEAACLLSYSPDLRDQFRRTAGYVDRILKGARPGDLPVEQPTKFELVINLKTAKALGLTIPPSLLLRADQVIE